jgi:hypothetical protein
MRVLPRALVWSFRLLRELCDRWPCVITRCFPGAADAGEMGQRTRKIGVTRQFTPRFPQGFLPRRGDLPRCPCAQSASITRRRVFLAGNNGACRPVRTPPTPMRPGRLATSSTVTPARPHQLAADGPSSGGQSDELDVSALAGRPSSNGSLQERAPGGARSNRSPPLNAPRSSRPCAPTSRPSPRMAPPYERRDLNVNRAVWPVRLVSGRAGRWPATVRRGRRGRLGRGGGRSRTAAGPAW